MTTPYADLPPERYWKSGVAERHPSDIRNLYKKKFSISATDRIATAGSCFAQHIARHMRMRGYDILDVEPPIEGTPLELAQRFGYLVYSARYGNIYTARQLVQLLRDASSLEVRDEDVWEKDGRFYDGLRPGVEPYGLQSSQEVAAHRIDHLQRVSGLMRQTDILVFTLGLTEAWQSRRAGTVYPTCPGVVAGEFSSQKHEFVNFDFVDVYTDMKIVHAQLKEFNPSLKLLLTVSPVPLTATASPEHVLTATTYSKAVLRAVCGSLAREFEDIDYFPSYEIIASPFSKGFFYEPNLRGVSEMGVEAVMKVFFSEHSDRPPPPQRKRRGETNVPPVICEGALLEAFAK